MMFSLNESIDVWFASFSSVKDPDQLARYRSWLDDDERIHYHGISCPSQRHQYLITRALVREVLSSYEPEIQPDTWAFTVEKNGKPRLDSRFSYMNLKFNLSHSEDLVVLAVCSGLEIGVDIENVKRPVFGLQMAERYFSLDEVEYLNAFPMADQNIQTAELWTLKEAYLKARGLGLRMPLNRVAFSFEEPFGLDLRLSPQSEDRSEPWHMWLYSLKSDYRLAIALKVSDSKQDFHVTMKNWESNINPSDMNGLLLRRKKPSITLLSECI